LRLDLLVFSAHPDDAEIGMGATLALHARLGYAVGVVDLTWGELSSTGSNEARRREVDSASRALGLAARECLGIPDGAIEPSRENVDRAVECLRRYRPGVVLAPHGQDRHPDHRRCAELVEEAVFSSGLARFDPGSGDGSVAPRTTPLPHRPRRVLYYLVNSDARPSLVVDVSSEYERKREALRCYESQFVRRKGDPATPLNDPAYLKNVEARDRYFGSLIGAQYGEGFVARFTLRHVDLTLL